MVLQRSIEVRLMLICRIVELARQIEAIRIILCIALARLEKFTIRNQARRHCLLLAMHLLRGLLTDAITNRQ